MLRAGVIVSAALIVGGLAVSFTGRVTSQEEPHRAVDLRLTTIFDQAVRGYGFALMEAGLLVLVVTPVLRVAVALVLFVGRYRDWSCTALTATLLALVVGSLVLLH